MTLNWKGETETGTNGETTGEQGRGQRRRGQQGDEELLGDRWALSKVTMPENSWLWMRFEGKEVARV
jgi:hypothetical protein